MKDRVLRVIPGVKFKVRGQRWGCEFHLGEIVEQAKQGMWRKFLGGHSDGSYSVFKVRFGVEDIAEGKNLLPPIVPQEDNPSSACSGHCISSDRVLSKKSSHDDRIAT